MPSAAARPLISVTISGGSERSARSAARSAERFSSIIASSAGGVSGELTEGDLPDLSNWNSLGTSLSEERFLPGSAQESAVIFVLGGEVTDGSITTSTDWTNY